MNEPDGAMGLARLYSLPRCVRRGDLVLSRRGGLEDG